MPHTMQTRRDAVSQAVQLPKKLAICSWQWAWVTSALPDEPYGDLEAVMVELKERGFNTIRIDAGLNWCFRADGTPRGEVQFRQMLPGYSSRFRVINGRGGGRHDVLKRVIRLMQLAEKYDVYVILTSWEYMHSTAALADPQLRAEVFGVPEEERLMRLARHHDRLIRVLKDKGLHKQIAYVEPHNEVDYSNLVKGEAGEKLHADAIALLRNAHPDILVSGDFGGDNGETIADNVQVYDHHIYAGSAVYRDLGAGTVLHPDFDPNNPRKSELVDYLLEERYVPYDKFTVRGWAGSEVWSARLWLYYNLDIARFDRWMLQRYAEMEPQLKETARKRYAFHADQAARLRLPVVVEEGGFFCAPLNSRWEESEQGLAYLDFLTDLAIQHDFWGFLPTTYNGPECPLWWANAKWLAENNSRFVSGELR